MLRRRPVVVRRGPGLVGAMARTAVVAGTATAVSGRVAARQQARAEPAPDAYPEAAAPAPAPAGGGISDESLSKLERLATLQQQGIITEQEFAAEKAKILGL